MNTLHILQKHLAKFNTDRDWDQFHCPRNLAMSLCVEASELLECFLWTKDDDVIPERKYQDLNDEVADILICLLNFCEKTHIDLEAAFEQKLKKNALKYPVEKARGSCAKYDEL